MRSVRMGLAILLAILLITNSTDGAASDSDRESSEGWDGVGILVTGQDQDVNRQIEIYARSILKSKGIKVFPPLTSGHSGSAYLLISRETVEDTEASLYGARVQREYETTVELRASGGGAVHHSIWLISVARMSVVPPDERPHLTDIKEDVRYMLLQFSAKYFPKQGQ